MSSLKLSIILLAYDMQRELPRTLQSLSAGYQKSVDEGDFEIILIENESSRVLDGELLEAQYPNLRYFLNSNNPSSPAYAMNLGLQYAKGENVAFCIDGARLLSPSIVRGVIKASQLYDDFVVATHAYHLGSEPQNQSVPDGRYNKSIEDALLKRIGWPSDGYDLFDISVFALSSANGWFGAIAESNCIAMPRESAIRLEGYSESFVTLGGGYVNLDFYKRAQELPDHQLIYLLGEGTFHQVHGGVATNRNDTPHDLYLQEYRKIRGENFEVTPLPDNVVYFGPLHDSAKGKLVYSLDRLKGHD